MTEPSISTSTTSQGTDLANLGMVPIVSQMQPTNDVTTTSTTATSSSNPVVAQHLLSHAPARVQINNMPSHQRGYRFII